MFLKNFIGLFSNKDLVLCDGKNKELVDNELIGKSTKTCRRILSNLYQVKIYNIMSD